MKLLEQESANVGNVDTGIDIKRVQVEMMEVDEVKPAVAAEQVAKGSDLYDFLVLVSITFASNSS